MAAALEFQLHQVGPIVTGGIVAHAATRAREVLQFFREQTQSVPDEVFLVAALLTAPDGSGGKMAGIAAQHSGSLADGEAFVRPLKAFGPPIMDVMGPLPYVVSNTMLDDSFVRGARSYWKSHFLHDLSDDAIDMLVALIDNLPTPFCQIAVEHFHGAARRVPVSETAYALRDGGFNVLIVSQWENPTDDERCITWCRNAYQSFQPFVSPRRYVNYLGEDDLQEPATLLAAYGTNLPRLRSVKKQYDPDNIFHHNLNVPPAD